MGIFGMLNTGASGMNAQSSRLGAISDNIANSQTIGYKSAGVEFSSLLLQSGQSQYNSGSLNASITHAISAQGSLLSTTSVTDLAVQGDGFYLVNPTPGTPTSNPTVMTRAGSFVQDGNGFLVNASGFGLMGYNSDGAGNPVDANGNPVNLLTASTANLTPIQIPSASLTASPTTGGTLTVNLDSRSAADATSAFTVTMTAFDNLGKSAPVTLVMTNTAASTWSVVGSVESNPATNPPTITALPALDDLVFNADGSLSTPASQPNLTPPPATFTYALDLSGVPDFSFTQNINIDMSASTQMAAASSTLANALNGSAPSEFDHLTISETGVVNVIYASGVTVPKFVIPLAKVEGTNNLEALAGNVFAPTTESGSLQIGLAKSSGLGAIKSTSLEQSSVDIANELANMIETQRIFEANSKVFQTGSTLTDTLVSLVR